MIVEIPVLKFFNWYNQLLLMLGQLSLLELDTIVYWLSDSVTYLILGHFSSFFEGAYQFWASVAEGVGGWGVGWEVAKACVKVSRVDMVTRAVHSCSRGVPMKPGMERNGTNRGPR